MQNFSFFESGEKGFTSARKCDILMKSPIEVWLSLVEHYVRDVGAASSNLVTSTNCRRLNYEKKLVIQPFFVTWGVLRKTVFFPKWQVNTGKWQVKWQVESGQFVPVVGILGTGSVVQSRKKANGFEQKHEKCTAYRPRHYTSSLSESKWFSISLPASI